MADNLARKKNTTQVDKSHYVFQAYSSERRYVSYYHQVGNVFEFISKNAAKKILIAGKGDGVVPKILEAYDELLGLDLTIHTYDFAADLKPHYLGDLANIGKTVTEKYDVVVCCQVLEHLPMIEAMDVVAQMRKLSRYVILSLPYKAITVRGSFKMPVLPELDFCLKVPVFKQSGSMVDDRHYWELGCSISVRNFKKEMTNLGYKVLKSYILKKHGNIYFVVLESENL